jgi:hypothetical protein
MRKLCGYACFGAAFVGVLCLECGANTGLLDGRVAVADTAGLNPSTAFTLEAWIRPTTFHFLGDVDDSYQSIIYKWVGGGSDKRSYLLAIYEDQVEFAVSTTGGGADTPGIYSNTHLSLDQWVHIAGVYDGATMALFINGDKDTATLSLAGGAFKGQAPVYIGGTHNASYQRFDGSIDEVRISDVARYSGSFTTPSAEFSPDVHTMLLMHLNEGIGTATDNIGLLGGDGTLDAGSGWGDGAPIVPEPATLALLALGGLLVLRHRPHSRRQ